LKAVTTLFLLESVDDHEPILGIEYTGVATDHIGTMAQTGIVELVIIGLSDVLIAYTNG
jgi:hypothetical protein